MTLKFSPRKHPGSGYTYVICDVCGAKFRRKDTVLVKDKWNTQNNLVVCLQDRDRLNAQAIPFKVKERIITSPQTMRPRVPDRLITVENDDRVPSAPTDVIITPDSLGSGLMVTWTGPTDPGTSEITSYTIKRADPQLANHWLLTDNAGPSPFYLDTDADPNIEYTYIIAATNGAGQGPFSFPGFYPSIQVDLSINYLLVSQTDYVLTTSAGTSILI